MSYSTIIWGNACKKYVNPLILLQKIAMRIICNTSYLCHCAPLVNNAIYYLLMTSIQYLSKNICITFLIIILLMICSYFVILVMFIRIILGMLIIIIPFFRYILYVVKILLCMLVSCYEINYLLILNYSVTMLSLVILKIQFVQIMFNNYQF